VLRPNSNTAILTNDHRNLAGNLRSAHQNRMQRLMFTGNSTKRNCRQISSIDC
jgi:hypothetical protein